MKTARTDPGGTLPSSSAAGSERRTGLLLASLWAQVSNVISKITTNRSRGLRLCESLSLGDKRILAIVECDHQRFLVAATPQNISLLQSLGPAQSEESQAR